MTEQVLSVRLRAVVDGYQKAMDAAGRSTEQMATRAEKITAVGDRATETGGRLTRGLTLPIAGIGTAALLTAGNFEAGMREVQALTQGTASEMEMLQGQALKMGADTQFSANQAADAMSQLVKGGFDVQQTYEALPGVMQLAAASTIDIASAADIATNVLSGFGLEVENLAEVNDYLSQTANSSDTDVRELGEAFKYVGPVARGAGLSLEETTAVMGLMAENGIRGSMAGTALRGSIVALLNPSKQVAQVLEDLGINVVDSNGQLTSMQDVVKQLGDSGATTAEIMEIFGQRAGPAMVALVSQGSDSLGEFTDMLKESRGVAQNLADAKMGGLTGAIEQLKGSLETLAITIGEAGLLSFMTGLANGATSVVNTVGDLPIPIQRAGLAIAGLAAASGPAIWAFGKLATLYAPVVSGMQRVVGALQAVRVQLALAQMSGVNAGSALLTMFGPGAAIVAGIAALAGVMYLAKQQAEAFERSHLGAADAATALAESAGVALQEIGAAGDEAGEAAVGVDDFRRANQDAINTLKKLGEESAQRDYLIEIGYSLVQRGMTPEDAFDQVQQLADAAGVELSVDITTGELTSFDSLVESMRGRARDAVDAIGEEFARVPKQGDPIARQLTAIAEASAEAWQTDNVAGFIQILAEAEAILGDNAAAANYLADEAMKALGDGFGFSTDNAKDLRDVLEQVASGTTGATAEQEELAQRLLDAAMASGEFSDEALLAAAAAEASGVSASDYGAKVDEAGGMSEDAAAAVGELGGELDDQAQAAEDAQKALDDYLDSLRGSIDPFFAMADGLRSNQQAQFDLIAAQNDYNEVLAEHGASSLQAWEAEMKLAEAHQQVASSALDVQEASIRLKEGIDNGSISMEQAHRMMWAWMDAGLLGADTARELGASFDATAWQAAGMKNKVDEAGLAVQGLDGSAAKVTVSADTTQFWRSIAGIEQWRQRSGFLGGTVGFLQATPDRQRYGGGRAEGGSVQPGYTYDVGERGPETLHMFPGGGGMVTPGAARVDPVQPSMSDSRIVAAIETLGARLDSLETQPLFGQYHVHGVERPQSTEQLNSDARTAKALMS